MQSVTISGLNRKGFLFVWKYAGFHNFDKVMKELQLMLCVCMFYFLLTFNGYVTLALES